MNKQIKMTEEVRKQLVGLAPMRNNATIEYTPPMYDNVDEGFRAVFEIRQFTNGEVDDITEFFSKKKKESIVTKKSMEFLHLVLVGWETVYDLGTGEQIEYDGELDTMMSLPTKVLTSILDYAIKITGL